MLLPEGFRHVGDGRLDVDESRLQQLRVQQDLAEIYDIEESWFAKYVYSIKIIVAIIALLIDYMAPISADGKLYKYAFLSILKCLPYKDHTPDQSESPPHFHTEISNLCRPY
nr:uncharacterized protein LOC115257333 [Aedes albopictus]